jgi:peptidoglycan/xylan/chitin deacetylase (PgdA/CDA1 family)
MVAAQILEECGFRGTFNISLRNIVSERKADRVRMFPDADILTWREIQKLQGRGHDIASHGVRHNDLGLTTPEELEMEIVGSKRLFEARGIRVNSYACAFNSYTQKADELAMKHYGAIRGTQGINQLPFRGHVYRSIEGTEAVKRLPEFKDKPVWLVGAWHDINPIEFKESIRRVKESGVQVKTVAEMIGVRN